MPKYLDPKILSKIKGMELRARLVVEGTLVGLHKSPHHGFSVEFTSHRPYMPGDEIRRIDWKVYGRTDRYYLKQFEEETNLRAYIILDGSKSMSYKSNTISKFEYASYLAASLAYLLVNQKDAVSLTIFDKIIRSYIPPSTTRANLSLVFDTLDNAKPQGETSMSTVLEELSAKIKRRGLIILLSDLFDDEDRVIHALRSFRAKKNEVLVFHILDEQELKFNFEENVVARDLETNEELPISPKDLRNAYLLEIENFINTYKRELHSSRIDYLLISTSSPLEKSLTTYLAKRKTWRF